MEKLIFLISANRSIIGVNIPDILAILQFMHRNTLEILREESDHHPIDRLQAISVRLRG